MNNYNFVFVKKEIVEKAAVNAINFVEREKEKIKEQAIQKELNRKFFPAKNREEAFKKIRSNYYINNCTRLRLIKKKANDLLSAARLSSTDELKLSFEYANFVYRYKDSEK